MPLRYSLLALLLAGPVAAQDYGVFSQTDLADGGSFAGIEPRCLFASEGFLGFFDAESRSFLAYEADADAGERTAVLFDAATLDDVAGFAVNRCHDAALRLDAGGEADGVFFVLGDGTDEAVIKFDGDGDAFTRLVAPAQAAGAIALALDGQTLYVGRIAFAGAPEDGIVRVSASGTDQTPTVVVENSALDIFDMAVVDGTVYATSSKFGDAPYRNVVAKVEDPSGTPALSVAFAPCEGANPAFIDCGDGGVEEIEAALVFSGDVGSPGFLISNNAFSSDVVVVAFTLDGQPVETVFSGNALLADPDVSESTFTVAFDEYMAYDASVDRLYIAGRSRIDTDAEAIYFAEGLFALPADGPAVAEGYGLTVQNPVSGRAVVTVDLPAAQAVRLVAYDALGRRAAVLADGPLAPGASVAFEAAGLAPGLYVLRLEGEGAAVTRTVTVVR